MLKNKVNYNFMEPDYVKLKEVKPALSGYIRKSQSLLKSSPVPDEKVVHDVRVLMKKARSLLRLAGPQMDIEFIKREDLALREVGRIMSSWREDFVLRKTLKDLKKSHQLLFSKLEDNVVMNELLKKREPVNIQSKEVLTGLEEINKILNNTGYHIRFEPMNNFDPQLLLKSLGKTYISVFNNYMLCRNNPKPGNLHEFRKRVKDFLYQLWFFRALNDSVVRSIEKRLDSMAQNLGKYNDHSQLINAIGYKYEYTANPPALDELALIIRQEQDKYLSKSWTAANKILRPGQNLVNILGFRLLVI